MYENYYIVFNQQAKKTIAKFKKPAGIFQTF